MDLRLERFAPPVVPRVLRDVLVVHEYVLGEPVRRLARQPVAALEQEDALARGRQTARERPAPGAGAHDDHVVRVHAQVSANSSGTMIRPAASISARAICSSPTTASAETSQKEQMRKVPPLPERPSSVSSVL